MEVNPNYPDKIEHSFELHVPLGQKTERLDAFITRSVMRATRTRVQRAIEDGGVLVNGVTSKANYKIRPGDVISITVMRTPPLTLVPQDLSLNILFQDDHVMVIDKPAGMTTHPGVGNRYGTLLNGVLWEMGMRDAIDIEDESDNDDSDVSSNEESTGSEPEDGPSGFENSEHGLYTSNAVRPGIVHRLDKDTSGVMVVAKNYESAMFLANQFKKRTAKRVYNAIVWGVVKEDSPWLITGDIGFSTKNRKLFTVVQRGGKPAGTEVTVLERFECATLIECRLQTGRTHQIRVHLSHNKHSIIGDGDYGGTEKAINGIHHMYRGRAVKALGAIQRQALHARTLGFTHPATREWMMFESPIPQDFQNVLDELRS